MSDFDALLAEYTSKENPKVHGVICKCVDRHGNPSLTHSLYFPSKF